MPLWAGRAAPDLLLGRREEGGSRSKRDCRFVALAAVGLRRLLRGRRHVKPARVVLALPPRGPKQKPAHPDPTAHRMHGCTRCASQLAGRCQGRRSGCTVQPMRWIFGGAVLVIAGIAARVVADSHPAEAAHTVRWGRGGHHL
jgi:hypothetical protein